MKQSDLSMQSTRGINIILIALLSCVSAANAATAQATLYCEYTNGSVKAVGPGTIAGNLINVGDHMVFSIPNIMSYDVPFSKCPKTIKNGSTTDTVQGILADVGGLQYLIYSDKVIKSSPIYSNLVTTSAGGILENNLKNILTGMLMNNKKFSQYQTDYNRSSLNMFIAGNSFVYDDKGVSDVFSGMPGTYEKAETGLYSYLLSHGVPDEKNAGIISTFITRYFNQSGFVSIPDYLMGMGVSSSGMLLGSDAAHIKTTITFDQKNNPILSMSFEKKYDNFLDRDKTPIEIEQSMNMQVDLVIDKAKSNRNGKLYVTADTGNFVAIVDNAKSTTTSEGKLVAQAVYNSFIQNIAITSTKNPNTDVFSVK